MIEEEICQPLASIPTLMGKHTHTGEWAHIDTHTYTYTFTQKHVYTKQYKQKKMKYRAQQPKAGIDSHCHHELTRWHSWNPEALKILGVEDGESGSTYKEHGRTTEPISSILIQALWLAFSLNRLEQPSALFQVCRLVHWAASYMGPMPVALVCSVHPFLRRGNTVGSLGAKGFYTGVCGRSLSVAMARAHKSLKGPETKVLDPQQNDTWSQSRKPSLSCPGL